jgi:hypothetical protein
MAQITDWKINYHTNTSVWDKWFTPNNEEFVVYANGQEQILFISGIRVHTPEFIHSQIQGYKLNSGASVIVPKTLAYARLKSAIKEAVPHIDYLQNPAKYGTNALVLAPMSVIKREPSGYMTIEQARKDTAYAIRNEGKERFNALLDVCEHNKQYTEVRLQNYLTDSRFHKKATGHLLYSAESSNLGGNDELNSHDGRFVGVNKNSLKIMPDKERKTNFGISYSEV